MKNEKDLIYVTISNKNAKVKFVFNKKGKLVKKHNLKSIVTKGLISTF